jgi:DNA-directed RNA polymerase specialized sigma24 family protein
VAGDFTDFVQAQWRPLVRTAVFLGCSLPDAEDVVQTSLMKAHRSWPKVSVAADPTAYTFTIMLNTLTKNRQRRWHAELATGRTHDHLVDDAVSAVDRRDESPRSPGVPASPRLALSDTPLARGVLRRTLLLRRTCRRARPRHHRVRRPDRPGRVG